VSQSRLDRQPLSPTDPLIAAEMLRQASEGGKPKDEGKDEKAMPLFWRVFGGTVLSIAALVTMTAYQSLTGTIAELRTELNHLNTDLHKELGRAGEAQAELVKKEEADSRLASVWRGIKEMQDERKELNALRERCQGLMDAFKSSEQERQRLAREVQGLRERQAADEERQALVAEVQKLRERLAGLEGQRGGVKQAGHSEKTGE
jgi:chromosome segregation ATPase